MLLATSPFIKRFLLSPRFYHHTSRYDGYWSLLLQQSDTNRLNTSSTNNDKVRFVPLDTTSNDLEVTPIVDAPTLTETLNDGSNTTSTQPQFVWLQNEKFALPQKPPPPENCCMSGCAYCVYDIYQEDMDTYKHDMNVLRQRFATANVDLPEVLQTKKKTVSPQANSNTADDNDDDDDDDDMDPTMKAFLEMEKKLNG